MTQAQMQDIISSFLQSQHEEQVVEQVRSRADQQAMQAAVEAAGLYMCAPLCVLHRTRQFSFLPVDSLRPVTRALPKGLGRMFVMALLCLSNECERV